MIIAGLVLASAAALLHVYIFYLESVAWTTTARGVFGTSAAQAEATKEMAFNQGFYNLFLAVVTVVGVALVAADERAAGAALVLAGAGSMAAAAAVLLISSPDKRRAALTQGVLPLLGTVAVVVGLLA